MKLSKAKKIILIILSIFVLFFVVTEMCILKYLKEYGYGITKLPETTLVYFHLSKGFTVHNSDKDKCVFVGRHEYIYDDIFSENGYSISEQMGDVFHYKNENNSNGFSCYLTDNWCHWFRIYELSPSHKIEDFT